MTVLCVPDYGINDSACSLSRIVTVFAICIKTSLTEHATGAQPRMIRHMPSLHDTQYETIIWLLRARFVV